ncbi:MAG: aldehyde dehydrogenase [Deltaproteobacteria bacterium]|nr:aldehyde dehydrogenase [Deltaproteobacteria bacterium]
MNNFKMLINGKLVNAVSGRTYPVINPATEKTVTELPLGGEEEVNMAVESAKGAFPIWSKVPVAERCRLVKELAQKIRENAEELGRLDTLDHGTPVRMAFFMAMGSAANLDFAADTARTMMSEMIPASGNTLTYTKKEPVGVVALITPWNAPLMMICDKLGGILATGNTCVIKPPSIDSLEALKLAEIISGLDLPPGTVNIITGPGALVGNLLSSHPDVDMVAFTGSCETGKVIIENAGKTVKKMGMELGGKNPYIILEDADLDVAVEKLIWSQYINTGMICAAPGRIYVHEKLYDEFVDRFVEGSRKITTGDPNDKKTFMGPVVSAEHRDKVESLIKSGIDEGATLLLGGKRPTEPPLDKGYYVLPTVFTGVTPEMTLYREEVFGPVACIIKFSSEDEVIKAANDNVFGLCAAVFTTDAAKGIRFANEIQAGTVWINEGLAASTDLPWGGYKESGFGKVSGVHGVHEFTHEKLIWVDLHNGKVQPMPS